MYQPQYHQIQQVKHHKYNVNRVFGKLYISSDLCAVDRDYLKSIGIKRILVVGVELSCHFPKDFDYMHVPIYDNAAVPIARYFNRTNAFIRENTLVHCHMGISRSATIVLAYMMYLLRKPLSVCYKFLKIRRPEINPNSGFIKQLKEYELYLFGRNYP